jgi:hypothetical protein
MLQGARSVEVRGSRVPGSLFLGSWLVLGLLALVAVSAAAQEPTVAAPRNYKLEFQNEFVRVIRASLAPRDHVPVHQHPTFPTVYVYLTDAGPTRFIHITPSYTVVRAAVRAGGIRYNRNAHIETHVVDNLSDAASEYLRIELKTTPGESHPDARMAPEDSTPVEDAQVRISRHLCRPGGVCDMPTGPAVVVALNNRSVTWMGPDAVSLVHNYGEDTLHHVWIELKTTPLK